MTADAAHRAFKDRLYAQFARIGKALASPHRLELLELLAQGERSVEALAKETGLSLANASQHLLVLHQSGLVERRKDGLYVHYRLADAAVYELCRALRTVAESRLADLDRVVRQHFASRQEGEAMAMDELLTRLRAGDVTVIDTRPVHEYAAGHIAGAVSIPIDDLQKKLRTLPKDREYVAYCRGPYCVYADRAVDLLRARGRRARRLLEGFPEWALAGHPIRVAPKTGPRP